MLGHGFDSRRLHLDEATPHRNADMKRFIRHSVGCFFVVPQVGWIEGERSGQPYLTVSRLFVTFDPC